MRAAGREKRYEGRREEDMGPEERVIRGRERDRKTRREGYAGSSPRGDFDSIIKLLECVSMPAQGDRKRAK